MIIVCTIQTFFTRDQHILQIDRHVSLFGATYFAVAAFVPIPLLVLRVVIPIRSTEKFGQGKTQTKIAILLFSSALLTLGAAFRAGIAYIPRPINNPAWYHSKACFYIFNFTIEWIVVALYAIVRVDRRFIIPNGAHGPGSYSGQVDGAKEKPNTFRELNEEDVFDDQPGEQATEKKDDVEAQQTSLSSASVSAH